MVPDTETKMSSFWRNFNHWLHWKLSFWQLPVQPVMKISSKWWHFRFSGIAWMRYPFNMSRHGDTHCVGGAAHHWCIDLAPNRWQAITWTQWWGLLSNSNKEQTSVKAPVKIQSKYNIHLRNYLNISPAKWACYISYACFYIHQKKTCLYESNSMHPVHAANLVANSDNTASRVESIWSLWQT